jgi:aminoglycoside phosphotransferase (APT) family kinase protein
VHGDFKANNLLITPDGELTVIDWELAHPGDPLEDLAWTMLWRTRWDVVGGLHSQADYTAAYIELTDRHVDEEALRFWHILALVKLWAMFATGMAEKPVRPTLRMMGRATLWIADQLAQELLAAVRS